jgi:flagellar basal-body rod protein FlgG
MTGRMERGLYIAASGMLAEAQRQSQIANDLANASTPGYKADRSTQRSFGDILLQNTATRETVGSLGLGVEIDEVTTNLAPAALRETGETLDFAVEGEGFFAVRTPQGERYTRNGQFKMSAEGTLVTALGAEVLGRTGQPIRVAADGKVDPADIGVFTVNNARKVGDSLLTGNAAGLAENAAVRQGALEGSGIDPARSMVDMMASFRAYEAGQKVIRTIDDTLAKAAAQVGSSR